MDEIDPKIVERLIALAKEEDLGTGDLSSALLPDPTEQSIFELVAEERGVFAGRAVAPAVLQAYDPTIEIEWTAAGLDGALIEQVPATLASIRGPLGLILSVERVLLNFLQRLCGVATLTRKYVDEMAGTGAELFDTRKTTPGWRSLEKYAVRCGGGRNHRQGLYDAVLIKDNHLAGIETAQLGGRVRELIDRLDSPTAKAMGHPQPSFVEVEADTLAQVEQLLRVVGIDVILLDNFSVEQLAEAVGLRSRLGLKGKVVFEASGGVTLRTIRAIAETGVERISVGAVTHSATALSLSLERQGC